MTDGQNDFDKIAWGIGDALSALLGNAHEPTGHLGDSLSITKDGFLTGIIRLERLKGWVEGLSETHKAGERNGG